MSLPECIEGCPQHESTHKTGVRHKKRHRFRTVSKTSLRGVEAGSGRMRVGFTEGCAQHESTQAVPKTFTGGPGGPGRVQRGGPGIQRLLSSRTNGSGYLFRDFKVVGLNLPTVSNTPPKGRRIYTYEYVYIYMYIYIYILYYICGPFLLSRREPKLGFDLSIAGSIARLDTRRGIEAMSLVLGAQQGSLLG